MTGLPARSPVTDLSKETARLKDQMMIGGCSIGGKDRLAKLNGPIRSFDAAAADGMFRPTFPASAETLQHIDRTQSLCCAA